MRSGLTVATSMRSLWLTYWGLTASCTGCAASGVEASSRSLHRPDVAERGCTFSPLLAPIDREEGALLWDSLGSDGL